LPRFACGRIRILEADVRDRVLSARSGRLLAALSARDTAVVVVIEEE
jgi:hypothetical protein